MRFKNRQKDPMFLVPSNTQDIQDIIAASKAPCKS